jgi:hypothetical protein
MTKNHTIKELDYDKEAEVEADEDDMDIELPWVQEVEQDELPWVQEIEQEEFRLVQEFPCVQEVEQEELPWVEEVEQGSLSSPPTPTMSQSRVPAATPLPTTPPPSFSPPKAPAHLTSKRVDCQLCGKKEVCKKSLRCHERSQNCPKKRFHINTITRSSVKRGPEPTNSTSPLAPKRLRISPTVRSPSTQPTSPPVRATRRRKGAL